MAEPRGSINHRLPIKLILPKQGAERRVSGGGPRPVPFRDVNTAYRRGLSNQVDALQNALAPQLQLPGGAAPVRVKIMINAVAKSHRPDHLFCEATCPIIGAGRLGELFVKATSSGLQRLRSVIETNDAERVIKELSCVEAIEVITPHDRRQGRDSTELLRHSPRGAKGFMTRVRLFNLGVDSTQHQLVSQFEKACSENSISFNRSGYASGSFTYGVECRTAKDVDALAQIIGVRSIAGMPRIRTLRPHNLNPMARPTLLSRSDVEGDVPVVVVVDSGIASTIPELESWVVGRESQVAPSYRNADHGTFVAGLVCLGAQLNPNLAGIDPGPCAVFDLQLIPNDDPSQGDTDSLLEQEFLISLEAALQAHANEYRVWALQEIEWVI